MADRLAAGLFGIAGARPGTRWARTGSRAVRLWTVFRGRAMSGGLLVGAGMSFGGPGDAPRPEVFVKRKHKAATAAAPGAMIAPHGAGADGRNRGSSESPRPYSQGNVSGGVNHRRNADVQRLPEPSESRTGLRQRHLRQHRPTGARCSWTERRHTRRAVNRPSGRRVRSARSFNRADRVWASALGGCGSSSQGLLFVSQFSISYQCVRKSPYAGEPHGSGSSAPRLRSGGATG